MDQRTKDQIHYLILKTHSLTGIVPVGAFLVLHFSINSLRTVGVWPYQISIDIINNLPFLMWIEGGLHHRSAYVPLTGWFLYIFFWEIKSISIQLPTQLDVHLTKTLRGSCFCIFDLSFSNNSSTKSFIREHPVRSSSIPNSCYEPGI